MEGTRQRDGEAHDRQHVDSIVPMQDLVDSYMKPFQACVEQGEVCAQGVGAAPCYCATQLVLIRVQIALGVRADVFV